MISTRSVAVEGVGFGYYSMAISGFFFEPIISGSRASKSEYRILLQSIKMNRNDVTFTPTNKVGKITVSNFYEE